MSLELALPIVVGVSAFVEVGSAEPAVSPDWGAAGSLFLRCGFRKILAVEPIEFYLRGRIARTTSDSPSEIRTPCSMSKALYRQPTMSQVRKNPQKKVSPRKAARQLGWASDAGIRGERAGMSFGTRAR